MSGGVKSKEDLQLKPTSLSSTALEVICPVMLLILNSPCESAPSSYVIQLPSLSTAETWTTFVPV